MTETQKTAFERGKLLIAEYTKISPEHADLSVNMSTMVGDMIADLQYTMSYVWEYPIGDVESVRIVALDGLKYSA